MVACTPRHGKAEICRKDLLARNIHRMNKLFPAQRVIHPYPLPLSPRSVRSIPTPLPSSLDPTQNTHHMTRSPKALGCSNAKTQAGHTSAWLARPQKVSWCPPTQGPCVWVESSLRHATSLCTVPHPCVLCCSLFCMFFKVNSNESINACTSVAQPSQHHFNQTWRCNRRNTGYPPPNNPGMSSLHPLPIS